MLQRAGLQSVLVDLLAEDEERRDLHTSEHRFDIDSLTDRVLAAVDRLTTEGADGPIVLFGASTGATAALRSAAAQPNAIEAESPGAAVPTWRGHRSRKSRLQPC
ncbi:MAG TPA: hypothetical protein VF148_05090 [Acidimicrobiia bacterium]